LPSRKLLRSGEDLRDSQLDGVHCGENGTKGQNLKANKVKLFDPPDDGTQGPSDSDFGDALADDGPLTG
jgi:hypothetical protein